MAAETGQPLHATNDSRAVNRGTWNAVHGVAEQVVFTLDHPVDIDALRTAWYALLEQHAPLMPAPDARDQVMEIIDWRDEPNDETRASRLERFLRERRLASSNAAPIRLLAIHWNDTAWRCVCELESALLDSRSFAIILRELFARYYARLHGVSATAAGSRLVSHVGSWLDVAGRARIDEAFWRDFLGSASVPFRLDLPRIDARHKSRDDCLERRIDADSSDCIRRLGKAADVTMNNLVQAAWALLLSRYAGTGDVVFGIVRSCRRSLPPGVDDALGAFVNTLPLRLEIRREANVFDLLWQARDQHRRMREHECAPLDEVAECVAGRAMALFDTTLQFDERDPMRALESTFDEHGPHGFRHHACATYPLQLQVYGEREIVVRLAWQASEVDGGLAQRMLEHFCRMLCSMAREPWIAVKDLDCLREEDKAAYRWPAAQRQRACGKARTVHGAFEDCARRNPDAIAIGFGEQQVSYGELNRRANRLAHRLRALGARPNELVGLCAPRSIDQVTAILGILKAGAGYLPLDPDYPAERLRFMLDDADVRFVVAADGADAALPDGAFRIVTPPAAGEQDDGNPEPRGTGSDLAYVIYTSGSTGKPKGVMVEHRNVLHLFDACESWLGPGIGDVWTQFHSFAFDFSVWEIWGALLYGGRLEIVPREIARAPDAFHDFLRDRRVTVLSQTPSAFRQLAAVDAERDVELPALRLVVFGGEKLDFAELRDWTGRHGDEHPRLVNMYGITETTVHVTYRPVLRSDTESPVASGIGLPLPHLYVRLLDHEGRPVPPGVRGEIHVGGAGVTRGYLNRPRLTGERFVADPLDPEGEARLYRSGDFAREMPNGELAYLGREDDQVKIRGFRIDLGEIGNVLVEHSGIEQAVVVARGAPGAQRLVAYYVSRDETIEPDELREALARRLPSHMLPSAFVPMESLPVNANSKIDLKALPDPASIPDPVTREEAETECERQLAAIWSRVLERRRPGRNDDFFALGGDSILAVKVVAAARAAGLALETRDIFRHPRLADLARLVEAAGREPGGEQGNEQEPLPAIVASTTLTPAQHAFFDQGFERPEHCNLARLFRVSPGVDIDALEKAMLAVVERHDALHARFLQDDQGQWQAEPVLPSEALEFSRIELDHLDEQERREAVALITADIQSSLSPSAGLLLRAAHFSGGLEEGDLLLIAVHRLAMDDASWKPLLQDLEAAYRAFAAGRTPRFRPATGLREQIDRLLARNRREAAVAEQAHWRGLANAPPDETFRAMLASPGREANARTVSLTLDAATSSALVDDARGESLSCARMLAAVAKAVAMQWPECARLRVDWLHRARLHGDVGPWSALLPVALDMASAGDTGKAVEAFERQLRNAENINAAAVLRYLGLHDNRRSALLLFDWLPPAGMPVANELLQPLDGDTGPLAAGTNRLAHPLTLTARIRDEQLAVSLRHDPDTIPSHTADAFARKLRDALVAVAAGQQAPRSRHSPEDFPLAALSCEELERFPIDLDRVQDIMTLSPIQRLHHALSGTDHDAGFDQWVFRLEGDIDEAAFDAAWQQLLDRHDALRAVFVDRGLAEPHQAVLRDVAAPVRHEDWRDVDEATRKRRLQAFLADDRRQGVCADAAPLMRLTLIREGAREWTLAWRHHQAFVDGWSWPVLAAELGELHDAIAEQRDAGLPPAGTFRAYLAALKARDIDAHAAFWREHLENAGHARTLIARGGRDGNGERSRRDMRRFEMPVRANLGERLDRLARRLRITPSLVFQSAWALLLAGLAQRFTVTMGVAFSGRTALPMPDRTVGAFVNDLPVHLKLPPTERIDHWLASLRTLQADLNHYQNASPQEIHRWAGIRPGERLFDTLLVMQNQVVGSAARHWGKRIRVRGIDAGMQTNYPLGIAVTPGRNLRIDFFHDASVMDADSVRAIADELHRILAAMADNPDIRVSTVINHLRGRPEAFAISEPRAAEQPGTDDGEGRSAPAAGDALEHTITAICESVLGANGFDAKRNFFDAGAQSLALIEIHERLQKSLDRQFPIVMLFRHPSVSALAAYLRGEDESAADGIERGAQQRAALMRRRMMRQPGNLER